MMFIIVPESCQDIHDVISSDVCVYTVSVNMLIGNIQHAHCCFSDLYERETSTEVKDSGINAVRSSLSASKSINSYLNTSLYR